MMTAQALNTMTNTDLDTMPFTFPQGMAGFHDAHQFGFIYEGHGDIVCIQSIDQPEAAFLLTPWDDQRLGPPPQLPAESCECIRVEQQDQIMWMLVLNPFASTQWVTANLKAPIALNQEERIGLQHIRHENGLDLRYPWMAQPNQ